MASTRALRGRSGRESQAWTEDPGISYVFVPKLYIVERNYREGYGGRIGAEESLEKTWDSVV